MQNVSTFTPQPGQTTVGEMRQTKIHQMVPRAGNTVRVTSGQEEGDVRRKKQTEEMLLHWHCSC